MQAAAHTELPVIDHCEDTALAEEIILTGSLSCERNRLAGLHYKPPSSEEVMVARDVLFAHETGCRLHVQHISSAGSVALLRFAAHRGIPASGEVTPHHIALTCEAVSQHGTNAKMNPPLREESDRTAILEGLKDGTIAVIATDHAPHTAEDKKLPLAEAPYGVVGLETAVPVCMDELVHTGVLTLPELIAKFTRGPRELLGLEAGTLSPGAPADITVLDPQADVVVDKNTFVSKARNTPFHGRRCKGRVLATIVSGHWTYDDTTVRDHRNNRP